MRRYNRFIALASLAVFSLGMGVLTFAQERGGIDVDVNTGGGGNGGWPVSPFGLVIGLLVLLVVVGLVAMASRGGGGATIVKD